MTNPQGKEEGFILAHDFRGFSPQSLAPWLLDPWQGINVLVKGIGAPHGDQGAERQRKKPGNTQIFPGHTPSTFSLQLGPNSCSSPPLNKASLLYVIK
jgi:hypothetical protein